MQEIINKTRKIFQSHDGNILVAMNLLEPSAKET